MEQILRLIDLLEGMTKPAKLINSNQTTVERKFKKYESNGDEFT